MKGLDVFPNPGGVPESPGELVPNAEDGAPSREYDPAAWDLA